MKMDKDYSYIRICPKTKEEITLREYVPSDRRETLHEFREVGMAFKDWIVRRIEEYGFCESVDFCSFLSESSGGRPAKEYHISLNMGKELAMVEKNAHGRIIRQYFIECEKALQTAPGIFRFIISASFLTDSKKDASKLSKRSPIASICFTAGEI